MGRMDTDRNQLENRLPLDLSIVGIGVIVHNVLSFAVFMERRKIQNQEQNILNANGTYILHNLPNRVRVSLCGAQKPIHLL